MLQPSTDISRPARSSWTQIQKLMWSFFLTAQTALKSFPHLKVLYSIYGVLELFAME